MKADLPPNEAQRINNLLDLKILDTPPEPEFDIIVKLACNNFNVSKALVSLIDSERQWFKARVGIEACETSRDIAFCSHAILNDEVFVVEDATKDERFFDNPLVTGDLNIRFYAGAPLIIEHSIRLGTLCIIDDKPREFSQEDKIALAELASLVVAQLQLQSIARTAINQSLALQEARKITARSELILDAVHDGIAIQDKNGKLIFANKSACEILGRTQEMLLSSAAADDHWYVKNGDDNDIEWHEHPSMRCLLEKRAIDNEIISVIRPNGERRWLKVSARPFIEDINIDDCKVVVSFSDITEERQNEKQLRDLSEKAEAANRAKTAFLANMSHEIRTPLNGIIGMVGALSFTKLEVAQREMIDIIENSGHVLQTLLNDILDISKVEAGQLSLENCPIDILDISRNVIDLMRPRAQQKSINLVFENKLQNGSKYIGDSTRIQQIISNLISNAIKFTDIGEVTLCVSDEYETLKIEVEDSGIGMDDEALKQIFKRFTQADSSITRRFGGTGLGLSICEALTKLMGGEIRVSSTPMVGTIFTVSLKLMRPNEILPVEKTKAETPNFADIADNFNQVLLVEDHPVNQKVFRILLEPLGFNISIANNGQEAIELYNHYSYDIIFMDMQMPIMDGLCATKAIREIEAQKSFEITPIIMLTANAAQKYIDEALEAGADEFVSKPFSLVEIVKAVEKIALINTKPKQLKAG